MLDRRVFLESLALTAAGTLLGRRVVEGRDPSPCAQATSKARLTKEGEPGEPLHVTGRVFAPDGATAAPGVILYAYQTDSKGYYNRPLRRGPRIRGWMKTDADGRYEFVTIRPAPYPNEEIAAHIHFQIWGAGYAPQWLVDLLFADDPLVSAEEQRRSDALGRFAFVRPVRKDGSGVWQATLDLRAKPAGDSFEDNIRHGLSACGVSAS